MPEFELHPRLEADCHLVARFPLSRLLLMDDANFPWFILVPERLGISEIFQLSDAEQVQLTRESVALSRALSAAFAADKLNIAALGNMVPQLHVHHIVRYRNDPVWPDPVWGKLPRRPYQAQGRVEVVARLRPVLGEAVSWVEASM